MDGTCYNKLNTRSIVTIFKNSQQYLFVISAVRWRGRVAHAKSQNDSKKEPSRPCGLARYYFFQMFLLMSQHKKSLCHLAKTFSLLQKPKDSILLNLISPATLRGTFLLPSNLPVISDPTRRRQRPHLRLGYDSIEHRSAAIAIARRFQLPASMT